MRRIFLISFAALALGVPAAHASTVTCDAPPNGGVPVDVMGLTITCGSLTFDQFNVVNAGGAPSPLINLISASFAGGTARLAFNPNLVVPSGSVADLQLFFRVTGVIDQIDLGVGPSRASIVEGVCTGAFTGGVCSGTPLASLTVFSSTLNQPIFSTPFPVTTPTFIFKDITVDGRQSNVFGAPGNAALSSFTQSFHAVPEPASMTLLGTGLLGVLRYARRRRREYAA